MRLPIWKAQKSNSADITRTYKKSLSKLTFRAKLRLALIGVPAVLVLSTTGSAFASVHICEVNGHKYCVGAPTINPGDIVEETVGGRQINEVQNANGTYNLKFTADPSKCVGVNSNNGTIVRNCTDRTTAWTKEHDQFGNTFWFNDQATLYLTGHNNLTGMVVDLFQCSPNCFQAFNN